MIKSHKLDLFLFLAAAFLLALPLQTRATTISEYQQNLKRAVSTLESQGKNDERDSSESSEQEFVNALNTIRSTLPEKQTIDFDGSAYDVDNTPLHQLLKDLEKAPSVDRDRVRLQVIDSLKSISERIDDLEKARVSNSTKEESSRKLKEILSRSEYASKSKQRNALVRLIDRFIRWLSQFFPEPSEQVASKGSPLTLVAQIVVVLLAAAVIIFACWKLIKHFSGRTRKTKVKKGKEPRIVLGEKLEPDASAKDLLGEAEAMARSGDIRAAIRKAYIALLVELGDRHVISLAQHKTNRDYLRSVSNLPTLYRNMTGMTNSFERHWYGFAESAPADWQNFKAAYQAALRTNE